jgi:hypothetical protein
MPLAVENEEATNKFLFLGCVSVRAETSDTTEKLQNITTNILETIVVASRFDLMLHEMKAYQSVNIVYIQNVIGRNQDTVFPLKLSKEDLIPEKF